MQPEEMRAGERRSLPLLGLLIAGQREATYADTPYGTLRRRQPCYVELTRRSGARPLREYETWSELAATAIDGKVTIDSGQATPADTP